MARFSKLSLLFIVALGLSAFASTPFLDAEVRSFLESDPIVKRSFTPPSTGKPLARRAAEGRRTRHLRPSFDIEKRQDLGYEQSFGDDIPQPIRGKNGATFLSPSNVEIDRQNPDSLAPPPTDNGETSFSLTSLISILTSYQAMYRTLSGASHSVIRVFLRYVYLFLLMNIFA